MKMKELLSDGSKWTQGASARDATGRDCSPLSPDAARWCLHGAVIRCYGLGTDEAVAIYIKLDETVGDSKNGENYAQWNYAQWNDAPERTFKEIKDLLNGLDI